MTTQREESGASGRGRGRPRQPWCPACLKKEPPLRTPKAPGSGYCKPCVRDVQWKSRYAREGRPTPSYEYLIGRLSEGADKADKYVARTLSEKRAFEEAHYPETIGIKTYWYRKDNGNDDEEGQ